MIAIVITARASYAKLYTVIEACVAHGLPLHLIVCASALLERYGKVIDTIRADWPTVPITEVWSTLEGANLLTSAKETGALLEQLSHEVSRLRSRTGLVGIICADRHEILGAAQAFSYQNVPLVHLQGGERSGSIDDKVRDATTHLADWHCVCSTRARYRVYGLTGAWDRIRQTGCPSIDMAKRAQDGPSVTWQEMGGTGPTWDLATEPFVVVLQHSVTDQVDVAAAQMAMTLDALREQRAIIGWPGQDAGAEAISKVLRTYGQMGPWHFVRNMPPARFLKLLTQARCLIGNSSAGIRESAYLGVPVVNIGRRQIGRERAANVLDVPVHTSDAIRAAILRQWAHGTYSSSALYGDGTAGEQIAGLLEELHHG